VSTLAGLTAALDVAARLGWAPLPLVPFQKTPAFAGLFDAPPRTESEIRAAWQRATRGSTPPNVGILLGASRILLLDADTPSEVAAWKALCAENAFDPGPPTAQTPGTRGADGSMKHVDGGHWYFLQPDDLAIPRGKIQVPVGPDGSPDAAVLYGGRHLAVIPPSIRDTGAYVPVSGHVHPLPPFLRRRVEDHLRPSGVGSAGVDSPFGTSEYRASEKEWQFHDDNDWVDLLPEGWVETAEERDGHIVYGRPGGSSSRSAVAHPEGCSHFPNAYTPPPMTFFSSESGDFIDQLWEDRGHGGIASATKLRLFALRRFHGDMEKARAYLRIPNPRKLTPTEERAMLQAAEERTPQTPESPDPFFTPWQWFLERVWATLLHRGPLNVGEIAAATAPESGQFSAAEALAELAASGDVVVAMSSATAAETLWRALELGGGPSCAPPEVHLICCLQPDVPTAPETQDVAR
jgi:hypothetical protein